jgi:hypothetical protein
VKVHFATQIYRPDSERGYNRILQTLEYNLSQPWIGKGTVFLDHCTLPWHHPALTTITLDRRATYADFLYLATGEKEPTSHLLFANSDIVFDQGIEQLAKKLTSTNSVACITRCELSGAVPAGVEKLQSQDGWMIRCQVIDALLIDQLKGLKLGVPGCEHLLATTLVAHGYDLWNPCLDCHILHMDPDPINHHTQQRRYWGLYAYIPECRVADVERKRPDVYFSFAQKPDRYFAIQVG